MNTRVPNRGTGTQPAPRRCLARAPGKCARRGRPLRSSSRGALLAFALASVSFGAGAANCTVAATALAFGVYAPLSGALLDANSTITVTCAPDLPIAVPYTLRLSTGGGTYAARRMAAGATLLQYQLYTDPSRSVVWGDGTGATSVVSGSITPNLLASTSASHTVHGRVPASQTSAGAGAYADTIVVTLTY